MCRSNFKIISGMGKVNVKVWKNWHSKREKFIACSLCYAHHIKYFYILCLLCSLCLYLVVLKRCRKSSFYVPLVFLDFSLNLFVDSSEIGTLGRAKGSIVTSYLLNIGQNPSLCFHKPFDKIAVMSYVGPYQACMMKLWSFFCGYLRA